MNIFLIFHFDPPLQSLILSDSWSYNEFSNKTEFKRVITHYLIDHMRRQWYICKITLHLGWANTHDEICLTYMLINCPRVGAIQLLFFFVLFFHLQDRIVPHLIWSVDKKEYRSTVYPFSLCSHSHILYWRLVLVQHYLTCACVFSSYRVK